MELSDIRLVVEIADCGSLTRTATLRGTTQSALSRQLSNLERKWGGRLFYRTGRGVVLTELGVRILPRLKILVAEARQLQEEMSSEATLLTGNVRIGLIPSTPYHLIYTLLKRVRKRYPAVKVSVLEGSGGQLEEWLATGEVGIATLFRHGHRAIGMHEELLSTIDTYLVGPMHDRITKSPTVNFSQLAGLPLVLSSAPSGLRGTLEQIALRKGIALTVVVETNSLQLHRDLVTHGGCYTILSSYGIQQDSRSKRLQTSRIVNPQVNRFMTLATTSKRPLSIAEREVAVLLRQLAPSSLIIEAAERFESQ